MGVALDSANVPSLTFLEDCFYRRQSRSVVVRKAIALGLGCGSVVKSAAGKAADVVVCSYINVSGGDSLLATEMSQSLTPITRNSCLSSEQQRMVEGGNAEYRTECQAAPHRYLPSVRREPFSLMEVRSSPSQDLSHYSSASSRLHCNEATNVKGFPHIMLSSRRSAPADWNMPDGHQQALHSSSFFDEKSKTKNGEDYSACSGDQPNYSAYNASLIQEYRQHQSSLPSDPASAYSQADYHHPLLPSVAGYGMYPLLQKQRPFPVKPEIGETIPWDKKAMFAGAGSSKLRPDRDSSYLKPPPVDLDELSEDERERMRVKRERNRVAAAKCRNRRRELLERLEKEAEQLEREQEVLRDNVKKLQAQKRKLGSILDEHEPSCTNKVEEVPADTTTSEKKVETA